MSTPQPPYDPSAGPAGSYQPPGGYQPAGSYSASSGQPGYSSYPTGATPISPNYPVSPPAAYQAPNPYAAFPPGAPAGIGRPGLVTAAAVLAFIFGGFAIIAGLVILAATSVINAASNTCANLQINDSSVAVSCAQVSGYTGFFKALTAGLMIVAALLIWGGVVAMTGKNGQILVIGAAVYILLDVISIIVAISNGVFGFNGVLGVVAPILIAVFMLNPNSRAWFRSRGAKTF